MSNLVFRLPRYYQDSPQVSELERVLGEQAGRCACPSRTHWPSSGWTPPPGGWTCGSSGWGCPLTAPGPTATGGAASRPSSGGQGATTAEMLRSVVASFGFEPSQISVIEHPAEYQFEIVLSDLASVPVGCGRD